MVAKKSTLKGIIFTLILIVLAMGYSMYTTSVKNTKEEYVANQNDTLAQNTPSVESTTISSTQKVSDTTPVSTDNKEDSTEESLVKCEKDFALSLKENKTEYEKGRILVGFNKDISFSKAKSIVAKYDLTPALAGVDEDSYLLTRLLTVNVPTGRESHFVCLFKQDSSVRYSNISAYLFLHD